MWRKENKESFLVFGFVSIFDGLTPLPKAK
jgi:hypothetical protein